MDKGLRISAWRRFVLAALFAAVLLTVWSVNGRLVSAAGWKMGGGGADDPTAFVGEPFGMDIDPVNGYLFVADSDIASSDEVRGLIPLGSIYEFSKRRDWETGHASCVM